MKHHVRYSFDRLISPVSSIETKRKKKKKRKKQRISNLDRTILNETRSADGLMGRMCFAKLLVLSSDEIPAKTGESKTERN